MEPPKEEEEEDKSDSSPFHILMVHSDQYSRKRTSGAIDNKTKRDFVSKRHRAFQAASGHQTSADINESECSGFWQGVSPIERSLVLCCEKSASEHEEESSLGALSSHRVLRFISLLAMHCTDLHSRVLALAILERSLAEDKLEELQKDQDSSDIPASSNVDPPMKLKRRCVAESTGSCNYEKTAKNIASDNRSAFAGGRIRAFLADGGLRIIQRWLVDASTPETIPIPKITTPPTGRPPWQLASTPTKQASPTGLLLLPLLKFLADIPFDRQLITKSKINKQIRILSKEINSIAQTQVGGDDTTKPESLKHEIADGSSVLEVKAALDDLKRSWEEKAKNTIQQYKSSYSSPMDAQQMQLLERLEILKKDQTGEGEKPEWLARLNELQKAKDKKRPGAVHASTADLAKREREAERAAMMKKDLQKTQEERRKYLMRLRELKKKNSSEERLSHSNHSNSKRTVRWKDGMGTSSRSRNRDKLEEVFLLFPEQDQEAPPSFEGVETEGKALYR